MLGSRHTLERYRHSDIPKTGDTGQIYPGNHHHYFPAKYPAPRRSHFSCGSFSESISNFQALVLSRQRSSSTHHRLWVHLRGVCSPAHCCRHGSQWGPSGWFCRTLCYPLRFRVLVSYSPRCSSLQRDAECVRAGNTWDSLEAVRCDFTSLFEALKEMLGFIWKLSLTWMQEMILRQSVHF